MGKKRKHFTYKSENFVITFIYQWLGLTLDGRFKYKSVNSSKTTIKKKDYKTSYKTNSNPEVKHGVPECHHLFLDFYSPCMVHMNIVLHHVNRKEIYRGYIKVRQTLYYNLYIEFDFHLCKHYAINLLAVHFKSLNLYIQEYYNLVKYNYNCYSSA
jgi:hypothetical protein